MDDLTSLIPDKAGWVVAGAIATKLVDWLLSFRRSESERIAKAYDAVNTAQKQLVDSLFQQVAALRTELESVRAQTETERAEAEAARQADAKRIAELEAQVAALIKAQSIH